MTQKDTKSNTKTTLNTGLNKAGQAKKDEFYTQLVDIEKELKHYKNQFRNKVVYCNCDDPFESNFFKYFAANFNALGLKKLITTSYVKSPIVGGQLPLFEVEGLKPKKKSSPKSKKNASSLSTTKNSPTYSNKKSNPKLKRYGVAKQYC